MPEPSMQGHLQIRKNEGVFRVWKKRYLQLHRTSLYIFKNKEDSDPSDWIDLKKETIKFEQNGDPVFTITQEDTHYEMQARDKAECDAWRHHLAHNLNVATSPRAAGGVRSPQNARQVQASPQHAQPRNSGAQPRAGYGSPAAAHEGRNRSGGGSFNAATGACSSPPAPGHAPPQQVSPRHATHQNLSAHPMCRPNSTFDDMKLFNDRPEKCMTIEDFQILSVLGKGSYGRVLRVRKRDDTKKPPEDYALKIMSKDAISKPQHIMSERAVLQVVDYRFVVKLRDAFQTPSKLFLVLQYLPGGDLKNLLRKHNGIFPRNHALFYACGVLLALSHLHSINILYRDLKPENIVLDDRGYPVVTDLGLARELKNDLAHTICGTPLYLAPEIAQAAQSQMQHNGYTRAIDWWSFGVILYEMLLGITPFQAKSAASVFKLIIESEPQFPTALDADAISILRSLLVKDPDRRLQDPAVIRAHPFFARSAVNFKQYEQRTYTAPHEPPRDKAAPTLDEKATQQLYADYREKSAKPSEKYKPEAFRGFTYYSDKPNDAPRPAH